MSRAGRGVVGPAEIANRRAVVAGEEPVWYACYTRSRHEKRVDTLLSRRGFESYLPLIPRVSRWTDRTKRIEFPLFPGYVFARFRLSDLYRVLGVPGVATVVRNDGRPTPVAAEELENVRRFAAAIAATGVLPERVPYLRRGQRVRIVAGPLHGVEGRVVERRGRRRVLVGLEAIGQGLEVDVDAASLEVVGRGG